MMRTHEKDTTGGYSDDPSRSPGGTVPAPGRTTSEASGPGGYGEGLAGELPTGSLVALATVQNFEGYEEEVRGDTPSPNGRMDAKGPIVVVEGVPIYLGSDRGKNFLDDVGRLIIEMFELSSSQLRKSIGSNLDHVIRSVNEVPSEDIRYQCYLGVFVAARAFKSLETRVAIERKSLCEEIASLKTVLASIRKDEGPTIDETKEDPKYPRDGGRGVPRSVGGPPLSLERKGETLSTMRIAFLQKLNEEICEFSHKMEETLKKCADCETLRDTVGSLSRELAVAHKSQEAVWRDNKILRKEVLQLKQEMSTNNKKRESLERQIEDITGRLEDIRLLYAPAPPCQVLARTEGADVGVGEDSPVDSGLPRTPPLFPASLVREAVGMGKCGTSKCRIKRKRKKRTSASSDDDGDLRRRASRLPINGLASKKANDVTPSNGRNPITPRQKISEVATKLVKDSKASYSEALTSPHGQKREAGDPTTVDGHPSRTRKTRSGILLSIMRNKCYRCWAFGHIRAECRSLVDRTGLCFLCEGRGHRSFECGAFDEVRRRWGRIARSGDVPIS